MGEAGSGAEAPNAVESPAAFDAAIARLRLRLAGPLPGPAAHMDITPSDRPAVSPAEARALGSREGGALVLVYPVDGIPHLVLTLRRADLRDHAGQISLPGGRVETGESPEDAALREAWEELAIPPDALEILGPLTPIYIPPTRYLLHPTVAARPARPDFRPQASEVAELIEAPVAHFVGDAHRAVETWELRGSLRQVPFYTVGPHKVWGATAMVLRELATVWVEAMALSGAESVSAVGRVEPS